MVTHFIFLVCIILSMPLSKNKQFNKALYWISFALLFIFAAFRYGFGNDYFQYQKIFNAIHHVKGYGEQELADYYSKQSIFVLLNKISVNFYVFIGLTSLLFLLTIAFLIYKNVSDDFRWVGLLIFLVNPYIFLMNLSAIRQCLAMVFFIIAVNFAYKKKPIIYVLLVLLATLCHSSAVVLLPAYVICNERKFGKCSILIIVVLLTILLLIPNVLYNLIKSALNIFFGDTTYDLYLNGENSLRATILSLIFFIYIILNVNSAEGKTIIFTKLYIFATIFNILAYRFSMLTRLTMYFDVFSIVAIPMLIKNNIMVNAPFKRESNGHLRLCSAMNVYILPLLMFIIYAFRYYSFFTNKLWESFWFYKSILSVL